MSGRAATSTVMSLSMGVLSLYEQRAHRRAVVDSHDRFPEKRRDRKALQLRRLLLLGIDRNGVRGDDPLNVALGKALHGGPGEDRMRKAGVDLLGPVRAE